MNRSSPRIFIGIKRAEIQDEIHLEKSHTIEIINKLRNLGLIIKVGNGLATSYRVLLT